MIVNSQSLQVVQINKNSVYHEFDLFFYKIIYYLKLIFFNEFHQSATIYGYPRSRICV